MNLFLILFICFILLLIVLKIYVVVSMGWDQSPTCLVNKTVLITGANAGIGFYTAQDLAKRGAKVILACRDPQRGEEARKEIIKTTGNTNVILKILDLSSFTSIRKFADDIKSTEKKLDILINNAGVAGLQNLITKDGINTIMQTNHFGPFLLTILLIGLLKRSAPSRIINISSMAAFLAKFDVKNLTAPQKGSYSKSKLCNVLMANELAKRLEGSGVTVNSLHPGVVSTNILVNHYNLRSICFKLFGMHFFFKNSLQGAQTSIYAAVSKDIEGISGEFLLDCKIFRAPSKALNVDLQRQCWEESEKVVELTSEEMQEIPYY